MTPGGEVPGIADAAPGATRFDDFAAMLRAGEDEAAPMALRRAETVGRPCGDTQVQARISAALGRDPAPQNLDCDREIARCRRNPHRNNCNAVSVTPP
jgi:hypothetical protein